MWSLASQLVDWISYLFKSMHYFQLFSTSPRNTISNATSSPVQELLNLITVSVSNLEKSCAERRTVVPNLSDPFHPSSEAFRADPAASEAASIISAAALQLAAILTPPQVSLYHVVGGHFKAAALRVCLESNVTEILREAGPQGLHVNDITAKNHQDPKKLGRFLRILACHHIYREVKPDVFSNTRISSMLDTLKPSAEIIADPAHKHDGTHGLAALASHHLDEPFKAAAFVWEALADPSVATSEDPEESPFAKAINSKETLWQFHQRPEEAFRHHRFGIGMQGIQALQPADASLDAFDWPSLPDGSVVVDVGGGIGTSSLPLAREYPKLQIVVQDQPGVIAEAKQIWSREMSDALESGRVILQAQDFFAPQKQKNASVFILKQILHDWSDKYCTKILTELWNAANPDTRLVVMDSLIPFVCHDPSADDGKGIPGAVPHEAPAPLLANFGAVNEMGYNADIDMFLLFNSQERTMGHMKVLLRSAGWDIKIVRRREGDSTFLQSIEAIPVGKSLNGSANGKLAHVD